MAQDRDVVAFIHSYAPDGAPDPFMAGLIRGLANAGASVHVVMANHLVPGLHFHRLRRDVSERKLIRFIRGIDPAFILSTNRGGITGAMLRELDYPIVTWMVDHVPFMHHGGARDDLFGSRDHVVVSSSHYAPVFEREYPVLKGRVHFLPFATSTADFKDTGPAAQDIPLSFVGSFFHGGGLARMLSVIQDEPVLAQALIELSLEVDQDFGIDVGQRVQELGLEQALTQAGVHAHDLKMTLGNALSLNRRIRYLDAVSDLGLQFWGNNEWVNAASFSVRLLRCFHFGEFIRTRAQLVDLYQRSRLSLNISHTQAMGALPYRVFDVMSSRSLLLTEHDARSDLFRLFGPQAPVPTFRNEAELRKLVRHFLSQEEERETLVKECNLLLRSGFDFQDRARDFFKLVGKAAPADIDSAPAVTGGSAVRASPAPAGGGIAPAFTHAAGTPPGRVTMADPLAFRFGPAVTISSLTSAALAPVNQATLKAAAFIIESSPDWVLRAARWGARRYLPYSIRDGIMRRLQSGARRVRPARPNSR